MYCVWTLQPACTQVGTMYKCNRTTGCEGQWCVVRIRVSVGKPLFEFSIKIVQMQVAGWMATPGPNFKKPVSTKVCLAWNFFLGQLVKTGLPTKCPHDFQDLANNSWIPVSSNMQQMNIWLVILFLPRKKFQAKQIFVLNGFMKLGQVLATNKMFIFFLNWNRLQEVWK